MFFVQLLAQILAPIALVLTLVCNIVRFYQTGPATDYNNDKDALDWLEILVLNPITSALPMVSLSFSLYWNVANYIALAKIMNDYLSFRHVHVTEDPFDDTPGNSLLILRSPVMGPFYVTESGLGRFGFMSFLFFWQLF